MTARAHVYALLPAWICVSLVASAQTTTPCNQLTGLLASARSQFQDLRGPVDPDDSTIFQASRRLPGAIECLINRDDGLDSYDCFWEYPDSASMSAAYGSTLATVRACFSGVRERSTSDATSLHVGDGPNYSLYVRVRKHQSKSGRYRVSLSVERSAD
jgi:hypothetical protein